MNPESERVIPVENQPLRDYYGELLTTTLVNSLDLTDLSGQEVRIETSNDVSWGDFWIVSDYDDPQLVCPMRKCYWERTVHNLELREILDYANLHLREGHDL